MKEKPNRQPWQFAILVFALLLPTLVTWVYFQVLHGTDSWIQQGAYGVGKAIQFLLPVVWVAIFFRQRLNWLRRGHVSEAQETSADVNPVPKAATIPAAIGFGLTVVVLLIGIFVVWIQPQPMSASLHDKVAEKVASIGMDSTGRFILLGCFYALFHSFLEEYYWRWFVYPQAMLFAPPIVANLVSSVGFATHHVLLLGFYLGWSNFLTWFASACIAIGGFVWAWQYERSGRLLVPWMGHMVVDAGIFALGFWIIRDVF